MLESHQADKGFNSEIDVVRRYEGRRQKSENLQRASPPNKEKGEVHRRDNEVQILRQQYNQKHNAAVLNLIPGHDL